MSMCLGLFDLDSGNSVNKVKSRNVQPKFNHWMPISGPLSAMSPPLTSLQNVDNVHLDC